MGQQSKARRVADNSWSYDSWSVRFFRPYVVHLNNNMTNKELLQKAEWLLSLVDSYANLDHIDWDDWNWMKLSVMSTLWREWDEELPDDISDERFIKLINW